MLVWLSRSHFTSSIIGCTRFPKFHKFRKEFLLFYLVSPFKQDGSWLQKVWEILWNLGFFIHYQLSVISLDIFQCLIMCQSWSSINILQYLVIFVRFIDRFMTEYSVNMHDVHLVIIYLFHHFKLTVLFRSNFLWVKDISLIVLSNIKEISGIHIVYTVYVMYES